MGKRYLLLVFILSGALVLYGQDPESLLASLKTKYTAVKSYEAAAVMKTNVPFIKAPSANVTIYYRSPDQLKIVNQSGVSFIPKGSFNAGLGSILSMSDYTLIDAGTGVVEGHPVRIVRLLPTGDGGDIVLSTLYVDTKRTLVLRVITNTKTQGTYEVNMTYSRYAKYSLPDRLSFTFNTRDYKLPKGVTFDYDSGKGPQESAQSADNKGVIELVYTAYDINKNVPASVFSGGL